MTISMQCPSKLYVEKGIPGSSAQQGKKFPDIQNKQVVVSFFTKACEQAVVETLSSKVLDQALSFVGKSSEGLSVSNKRELVIKHATHYTAAANAKSLDKQDIEFYKDLFKYVECLTELKFTVIEDKFTASHKEDFKIAMCIVPGLGEQLGNDATSFMGLGKNPKYCYAAYDENISSFKARSEHDKSTRKYISS